MATSMVDTRPSGRLELVDASVRGGGTKPRCPRAGGASSSPLLTRLMANASCS